MLHTIRCAIALSFRETRREFSDIAIQHGEQLIINVDTCAYYGTIEILRFGYCEDQR